MLSYPIRVAGRRWPRRCFSPSPRPGRLPFSTAGATAQTLLPSAPILEHLHQLPPPPPPSPPPSSLFPATATTADVSFPPAAAATPIGGGGGGVPFPEEPSLSASLSSHTIEGPIDAAQAALDSFHSLVGLPWWATIVLASVTLRVALFPLVIHQMRYTAAKMKTAGPMLAKLKALLDREIAALGTDPSTAALAPKYGTYARGVRGILKVNAFNPLRMFVAPAVQVRPGMI